MLETELGAAQPLLIVLDEDIKFQWQLLPYLMDICMSWNEIPTCELKIK